MARASMSRERLSWTQKSRRHRLLPQADSREAKSPRTCTNATSRQSLVLMNPSRPHRLWGSVLPLRCTRPHGSAASAVVQLRKGKQVQAVVRLRTRNGRRRCANRTCLPALGGRTSSCGISIRPSRMSRMAITNRSLPALDVMAISYQTPHRCYPARQLQGWTTCPCTALRRCTSCRLPGRAGRSLPGRITARPDGGPHSVWPGLCRRRIHHPVTLR